MSVDVDAVNERLNGLVTLLKAVGVDGVSNEKGGTASKRSGMPDARQLDDDQIEAIIKKLQMAQSEAPQIIAALEAQAASKKRQQQQQQQSRHPQEPPEQKQQHVEEEEEESDEDSFDEDANYPMVGHGCSDDISVVSDLTTPTVVVGVPVPEEEHYRDTLPPMIVGGGGGGGGAPPMLIAPTKRKNLVGAVKPAGVVAPPRRSPHTHGKTTGGGAAAQRRKHYNATMEKLAHEGTTGAIKSSSRDGKPRSDEGKSSNSGRPHKSSSRQKDPSHPSQERTGKKSSRPGRRASLAGGNAVDWDQPASQSQDKWNAFEHTAATKLGKSATKPVASTMIDDDGFLMSKDIEFDPFAEAAFNPFQQAKQKKSSKKSKGHKPSSSIPSSNSSSNGSHGGGSSRPRRSRRASCM